MDVLDGCPSGRSGHDTLVYYLAEADRLSLRISRFIVPCVQTGFLGSLKEIRQHHRSSSMSYSIFPVSRVLPFYTDIVHKRLLFSFTKGAINSGTLHAKVLVMYSKIYIPFDFPVLQYASEDAELLLVGNKLDCEADRVIARQQAERVSVPSRVPVELRAVPDTPLCWGGIHDTMLLALASLYQLAMSSGRS